LGEPFAAQTYFGLESNLEVETNFGWFPF